MHWSVVVGIFDLAQLAWYTKPVIIEELPRPQKSPSLNCVIVYFVHFKQQSMPDVHIF